METEQVPFYEYLSMNNMCMLDLEGTLYIQVLHKNTQKVIKTFPLSDYWYVTLGKKESLYAAI
jgi:hypothetical protein